MNKICQENVSALSKRVICYGNPMLAQGHIFEIIIVDE